GGVQPQPAHRALERRERHQAQPAEQDSARIGCDARCEEPGLALRDVLERHRAQPSTRGTRYHCGMRGLTRPIVVVLAAVVATAGCDPSGRPEPKTATVPRTITPRSKLPEAVQ